MEPAPVHIGPLQIGGGAPLVVIAGPCVIESEGLCLQVARRLQEITGRLGMGFIFKASFDKANRTSLDSFRGPGLEAGLQILARVRSETGVPVLTDIHDTGQASPAAEVVDVLQIPAFLCRQTDLLLAAGKTGRPVNIKKGQFLAPWDLGPAVDKVHSTGNRQVLLTERGASFGYNTLVVDYRSLVLLHALGCPVVFDATHSVQQPGGRGASSGGQREFVFPLARAAVAVGVDALFMEVHPDPDAALSDGPNMVALDGVGEMLRMLVELDRVRRRQDW